MCSISAAQAFNGKLLNPKRFDILLVDLQTRGTHATGVWTPETGIIKNNISADKFIFENDFVATNIFLGHNRLVSSLLAE